MTKIILNDLSTISGNEQSAINLINGNNLTLETASDNTLSRDGTSPNQMLSSLDMNSFRILNCVDAINLNEPATYNQVLSLITSVLAPGTVTLGPGVATWLTTPTSANLAAAVTGETGTGSLVFNTSPTFITPVLGNAFATSLTISGTGIGLTAVNSGIELGSTSTVNTPFIDFHSSGNNFDFDSRIIANGGSGSAGQGNLSTVCNFLLPGFNDGTSLGAGLTSFSDLFLADGGVINWNNGNTVLTHSSGILTLSGSFIQSGPILILSGTAIPAGGTVGFGYKLSSTANFGVFFGSGVPTLSAAKGSLYLRSDGTTTNDRAYINTNGTTTWTALTTVA